MAQLFLVREDTYAEEFRENPQRKVVFKKQEEVPFSVLAEG